MGLRTRRALALAASVMFVAAGCGSTGTATPTTATSTGTPAAPTATPSAVASASGVNIVDTKYAGQMTAAAKTGGTVVVSDWQSPDFVNPYYEDAEVDLESFGMAFDGMVVVTQNLGYIPNLASEVPTTANGDVVVNGTAMDLTWKMKPNMKWSDGSPINCDDVIATWKWIMDKDQHRPRRRHHRLGRHHQHRWRRDDDLRRPLRQDLRGLPDPLGTAPSGASTSSPSRSRTRRPSCTPSPTRPRASTAARTSRPPTRPTRRSPSRPTPTGPRSASAATCMRRTWTRSSSSSTAVTRPS